MSTEYNKSHLTSIENFSSKLNYHYPRTPAIKPKVVSRNRSSHGANLLEQFGVIQTSFELNQEIEFPENIVSENVIYVEFISEWEYDLNKLNTTARKPKFHILNIKEERSINDQKRYRVLVMLTEGAISDFITKIEDYLLRDTSTGRPLNEPLLANISLIQEATLRAFWTDEPEIAFPETGNVWWEAWFRKEGASNEILLENLIELGIQTSQSELEFPEHKVRLVKGTAQQLSASLLLLDNLSELRKPQELADFIRHESSIDQRNWIEEVQSRTNISLSENGVIICLLDSGVYNKHPLLASVLSDNRLYTYRDDWGTSDSHSGSGHGTPMAGLAAYGDFNEILSSTENIEIFHGLESFKIYNPNSSTDPDLYGAVYEYACSTPIVDNPENSRVFCLSVTNKNFKLGGRPSSSSASLDNIAFGELFDPSQKQMILVSGGNVKINSKDEYPDKNILESIHDPGQAYNVITVGSYTRKNHLNINDWPGWKTLAESGAMAPSNSTSILWQNKWPIKPDIVMEGGNMAYEEATGQADSKDNLSLLSTSKSSGISHFTTIGDTSAAVALASKMVAELRVMFPNYWPETIRALLIHSAEWTESMKKSIDFSKRQSIQNLIRSVGYGTPIFRKATNSASNCLTLISESTILPYKLEGNTCKYNEYHLYELPWPAEVLLNDVGEKDAKLTVTISYFIEPNPGNRQYSTHFSYHSHELDFKLIKPGETINEFKRRISAASKEEREGIDYSSESWTLGERIRSGSIKKDIRISSGAELSTQHVLAIYPKNGWYKLRKNLKRYDQAVRYSLIVTIETEDAEIDLYTPVYNSIQALVEITT